MALNICKDGTLEVLKFPNPILRQRSLPLDINKEDKKELAELIEVMAKTMYITNGVGLAAPQVGISKRLFIIDIDQKVEKDDEGEVISRQPGLLHVFINPVILSMDGNQKTEEGCLSVPGIYEDLNRAKIVNIEYYDKDFNKHTIEAKDFFAVVIQHEYDHIEGKLFIDRLPMVKRTLIKNRITKGKNL